MIEEIASGPSLQAQNIGFHRLSRAVSAPPSTRLAINETTTYRWSFLEDVNGYRNAGIEAIGAWRSKLTQFGEERGVELIRDSGMAVSSLSWAGVFTGANGCSFEESVDDAREAARLAGQLNAESLILISGARAGHTIRHARRLVVQALQALADDAAEHQLQLAIQPMSPILGQQWSFLNSIDETLEIIHQSGVGCARIAFDVYHLWQEHRLLERIVEIAPLVSTVQLSDCGHRRCSEADYCLPGDGLVPLRDIMQAFLDADYSGYFEIGIWSEEVWNSNYDLLLGDCRERFEKLCRP